MASILPGYEYDIFISYRQNDNQPPRSSGRQVNDGWVTNFVTALKDELEATVKNPVTIYFDENPHDGLLETHQVGATLDKKLKCIVFIPIISQTYCDIKSFAWAQEFLPFVEMAKQDELGMNITLSNGNVVSRVLPVRIHDLESEDHEALEALLDGPLRPIDFIYREPGVNSPLKPDDDRSRNLENTEYKYQLNKVANSLKDIGKSVAKKTGPEDPGQLLAKAEPPKTTRSLIKPLLSILIVLVIGAIFYWGYTNYTDPGGVEEIDKSIAVLAFENMSSDPDQEYLADGISEELLNLLAKVPELTVIGRTSSFAFKGKNEDLREIARKLEVAYILEGSVRKSGNQIRITAQLIQGSDGSHIWSETYDRTLDDIFKVQDEIAGIVSENLKVTLLNRSGTEYQHQISPEAYNLFLRGKYFYESTAEFENTFTAIHWFEKAIELDSAFSLPWTYLSMCYWRQANSTNAAIFVKAKQAAQKAIELDPTSAIAAVNMAEILDNEYELIDAEKQIENALKLDPSDPYVLRNACRFYTILGKWEESIKYGELALANDPIQITAMLYLSLAYFYSGSYDKLQNLLREGDQDHYNLAYLNLKLHLMLGRTDMVLKEEILMALEDMYNSEIRNTRETASLVAAAYFIEGNQQEAEKIIAKIKEHCSNGCAFALAEAYTFSRERDKVLDYLQEAYENKERGLLYLGVSPVFKDFRSEPRVKEILRKMQFSNVK